MTRALLILLALVVLVILLARLGGARMWLKISPFRDLGPVDFAMLKQRATPNSCLVAPLGQTPQRPPDATPPDVDLPAPEALRRLLERAMAEPRVTRLDDGSDPLAARVQQRTWLMDYPDIVDIRAVPLGEGRTTFMAYSRSAIGRKDFGVNAARLARWFKDLAPKALT
jgi:hypothetical protein